MLSVSAGSLLSIINDLLDFTKIDAGKLQLEAIAFDLVACVESVARLFATEAEKKGKTCWGHPHCRCFGEHHG